MRLKNQTELLQMCYEKNIKIAELEEKLANADYQLEGRDLEIQELEAQIEKMKCDVLSLIKDRMNDDIDQNIIERLAEKWEIKENNRK